MQPGSTKMDRKQHSHRNRWDNAQITSDDEAAWHKAKKELKQIIHQII